MSIANFAIDNINEPYHRPTLLTDSRRKVVLSNLLKYFLFEKGDNLVLPDSTIERQNLLRALMNIRHPKGLPQDIQVDLDCYLWTERVNTGIVSVSQIPTIAEELNSITKHSNKICLWKGDITRVDCDAIVNAANNQLLGCFSPLHNCIDNAIHSAAGIQLRLDCLLLMQQQQHLENTGLAKITRAYNLPSRFVLHTVGPIVNSTLKEHHKEQLASSYISCLSVAAQYKQIKSIVFCCISTGVFGFPADEAANIAITTISQWLNDNPDRFHKIIFNVFAEQDYERYKQIFK